MVLMLVGLAIAAIAAILGIFFLYTVLEALKIVAVVAIMIFGTLWLWIAMRKNFRLDSYLAFGLAFVTISFVAVWAYSSWWALMGLATIIALAYPIWGALNKIGFKDFMGILKDETGKKSGR